MDLVVVLSLLAIIIGVVMSMVWFLVRRQTKRRALAFQSLVDTCHFQMLNEPPSDVLRALKEMTDWGKRNLSVQNSAVKHIDNHSIYILEARSQGQRISSRFSVVLFASPYLNLPPFRMRVSHKTKGITLAHTPEFTKTFELKGENWSALEVAFDQSVARQYLSEYRRRPWIGRGRLVGEGQRLLYYRIEDASSSIANLCRLTLEGWEHFNIHVPTRRRSEKIVEC